MITISNELALQMLEDRLDFALELWGSPSDKELYMSMYENSITCGFDYVDFDPKSIVDNDVVNYCVILRRNECEEDFNKVLKLYQNGEYEIQDGTLNYYNGYYTLEAYDPENEKFLLRYN